MPRAEVVSTSATPAVVIDNGSGVLKAGMAGASFVTFASCM